MRRQSSVPSRIGAVHLQWFRGCSQCQHSRTGSTQPCAGRPTVRYLSQKPAAKCPARPAGWARALRPCSRAVATPWRWRSGHPLGVDGMTACQIRLLLTIRAPGIRRGYSSLYTIFTDVVLRMPEGAFARGWNHSTSVCVLPQRKSPCGVLPQGLDFLGEPRTN